MQATLKRNILTASIAVSSAALLYAGITFAREPEVLDDRLPRAAATASPSFDDKGGLFETGAPEPEAADDHGNDGVAESAEPIESFDDHGGNRAGNDDASPTASFDDHGGSRATDDASPTDAPDDNGGRRGGSDDGSQATPSPSASPDDNGGHGSDD